MQVVVKARRGLLQRGDRETINSLIECLHHPEQRIREAALESFPKVCRRGDKETIAKLIGLFSNGTEWVRMSAVGALGLIAQRGDEETIDEVLSILNSSDDIETSTTAILALQRIAGRGHIAVVDEILSDKIWNQSEGLKEIALKALADLAPRGDRRAVAAICADARHESATVRAAAVQALSAVGDKTDRVVASLVCQSLEDGESLVRSAALSTLPRLYSLYSLAQLYPKPSRSILRMVWSFLGDSDVNVRVASIEAVSALLGQQAPGSLPLSKPDFAELTRLLGRCLRDSDDIVRREAEHALSFLEMPGGGGEEDWLSSSSSKNKATLKTFPAAASSSLNSRPRGFIEESFEKEIRSERIACLFEEAKAINRQIEEEVATYLLQLINFVSYTVVIDAERTYLDQMEEDQKGVWDLEARRSRSLGAAPMRVGLGAARGASPRLTRPCRAGASPRLERIISMPCMTSAGGSEAGTSTAVCLPPTGFRGASFRSWATGQGSRISCLGTSRTPSSEALALPVETENVDHDADHSSSVQVDEARPPSVLGASSNGGMAVARLASSGSGSRSPALGFGRSLSMPGGRRGLISRQSLNDETMLLAERRAAPARTASGGIGKRVPLCPAKAAGVTVSTSVAIQSPSAIAAALVPTVLSTPLAGIGRTPGPPPKCQPAADAGLRGWKPVARSRIAREAKMAEEAALSTCLLPSPADNRIDRKRMAELANLQSETMKVEKNEARGRAGNGFGKRGQRPLTLSVDKYLTLGSAASTNVVERRCRSSGMRT